jgi:hypothetical protein
MPKFVKGQPRPANAGRKKGTQNRATIERNKAKDEAMNAEAITAGLHAPHHAQPQCRPSSA